MMLNSFRCGDAMGLADAVRGGESTYGGVQAHLDQKIIQAVRRFSEEGSRLVRLPLER